MGRAIPKSASFATRFELTKQLRQATSLRKLMSDRVQPKLDGDG